MLPFSMPTPLLPSKSSFYHRLIKLRRPLLLIAILIGFACTSSDESYFKSFFQPEAATIKPDDRAYLFTPLLYNSDYAGFDDGQLDDSLSTMANAASWATYLGATYTNSQITKALTDSLAGQQLLERLANSNPSAANYLRFAFDVQAAEPAGDPWNRTPGDTVQLAKLAKQARDLATATADPFLAERYAFQAVKLADEAGDYSNSRHYYAQLIQPLKNKTFISGWARCRQAGALLSLGEKDRALFEFAQVFANCPSRRHAAERSLRIHGLRFTEKALDLAKTDAERLAVYAVCAIQPKQDALPLLEKMVALDPKNTLNELVFAREINRNEYYFDQKTYPGYVDDQTRPDSVAFENRRRSLPDYTQKLLAFAQDAAKNTTLGNPAFYLTAAAYLHYLAGDYTNAKTTLDEAAKQPNGNKSLAQQIALQQMLLLSAQPGAPDATSETQFVSYLTQFKEAVAPKKGEDYNPFEVNFRFTNALTAASQQMANRYLGVAETGKSSGGWLSGCSSKKAETAVSGPNLAKAFVLRVLSAGGVDGFFYGYGGEVTALEDTTNAQAAQALTEYVASPAGEFDERLVKLAGVDADYAFQLLGRRHMAEGNYEAAAVAFANVKPASWQNEAFSQFMTVNPFTVKMPDEGKPKTPYSPLQFVRRMADLQTKAKQARAANKTGDDVAQLHYELGCGAYNLSYWGNAWLLNHRRWSAGEAMFYGASPADMARALADPYYTNSIAQTHFEQAAKEAKTPELAAKATYMAARCLDDALRVRREAEREKTGTYVADDDVAFTEKMNRIAQSDYSGQATAFRQQYLNTRFARDMETHCALYRDIIK
ncbi:hypothetical protein J2I47_07180 [Fibrella sp. HMF5335]|uniref:Tetratricopeptide repeat-containing protein n=1 Tax=Fibrella rubiginis TaxID=2817060 RepID=A0A939GC44_9BACT|nr:hypothetical protein [Fibrella rubiginis]MBO0936327.1 hypothetical protein [Fibrella rubiginis]